jgi:hypothetical protein
VPSTFAEAKLRIEGRVGVCLLGFERFFTVVDAPSGQIGIVNGSRASQTWPKSSGQIEVFGEAQ